MKIDLIALDLDDTLLNSRLDISEGNRRAIVAAENAGIEIVLATGRNYAGVKKIHPLLDLGRKGNYLVCSNGAEILEAATGVSVERLTLSRDFCHEASAFIDSENLPWQVYMDGKIFCSRINDWRSWTRKSPVKLCSKPDLGFALREWPGQIRRARRAGTHRRAL
jgi:hydroxymethylpyrimidine pyrophosphatase-like HAD family hydrolase